MTESEKAKAYDETIARLRNMHNEWSNLETDGWSRRDVLRDLEYYVPELAESESEDERIRKELICYFEKYPSIVIGPFNTKECIAWLEKQGENPTTLPKWKYKKDNAPLLRDSLILNKYGCVAKSPSGALVSDVWVIDYAELAKLPKEEIEKQGEQKLAAKVEPKFKIGDWAVSDLDKMTRYISEVHNDKYNNYYVIKGDVETECNIDEYDRLHHLWTIQDAKDGDVLVNQNGEMPFIFKECKNNHIYCYCGYTNRKDIFFDRFVDSEDEELHWLNLYYEQAYPATKEQRDLLFQKMKEAGYEWDAERKQLKKVEQKPTTMSLDEAIEHCKEKSCGNNACALEHKQLAQWLKELKGYKEQKPWSEEDEKFLNDIIKDLVHPWNEYIPDRIEDEIKWLKNRLKSLRPQSQWKPSDEQMDNK